MADLGKQEDDTETGCRKIVLSLPSSRTECWV